MLEYEPTRLERLADEAGLTYEQLWNYLAHEVDRRRRARYPMHQHAHLELDKRLERLYAANGTPLP